MKKVSEIQEQLRSGRDYILTSDYDLMWIGKNASPLNAYNDYIETVNLPGRSISTDENKIANMISAKVASSVSYEDFEVSWRVPKDFKIIYAVETWMNDVMGVDDNGVIRIGYFDDYCTANSCDIKLSSEETVISQILGLYPINRQAIAFSNEGGEYIKFSATFSCYKIRTEA
jgi:hypothetical protein